MLPSPWRACSRIPRQSGRECGWPWGLVATLILRRYRLSDECPINHQAGIRFGSPSKLLRLLPHSTVIPRSRSSPSSLRDSRSHLVRGLGTGQELASSVAKMATMPGPVPRTSQLSQLNRPQILGLSRGPSLRRKCPAGPARCTSLMLRRLCSRSR